MTDSNGQSRMVSYEQVKSIIDFMAQHVDLASGNLRSLEARHTSKRLWKDLTKMLNSCRGGTRKTSDGWRKYWSDFKNKLKNKVWLLRRKKTGTSLKGIRPLTKIEQRALSILGPYYENKKRRDGYTDTHSNNLHPEVKLETFQETKHVNSFSKAHSESSDRLSGIGMHVFPNPEKFPERFKAWVNIVGGKLETPLDYKLYYKSKKICDIHFAAKDRNRNNRINALAIPSLYLSGASKTQQAEFISNSKLATTIALPATDTPDPPTTATTLPVAIASNSPPTTTALPAQWQKVQRKQHTTALPTSANSLPGLWLDVQCYQNTLGQHTTTTALPASDASVESHSIYSGDTVVMEHSYSVMSRPEHNSQLKDPLAPCVGGDDRSNHSAESSSGEYVNDDDSNAPVIQNIYPQWLIEVEKKRADAELIRAKAEENRAAAAAKNAEAALAQAEALKRLADAADTQAEAIMRIASVLETRGLRDMLAI